MPRKIIVSWSSGKDSAWMLHQLLQDPAWEVVGLFTTLNQEAERIAIHGVRAELLRQQAHAIGLPLSEIGLPFPCDNASYEAAVGAFLGEQKKLGIEAVAFGDLFLDDIRQYRERQLVGTGLEPVFPIWRLPTERLAREMIAAGFRATVTCIDSRKLPVAFVGREYDEAFLNDLPDGIDPCGENGEFHTFVHDGPILREPVQFRRGEIRESDGFVFLDLLTR